MAGDNPDARAKKRTGLRQLSEITQTFLSNQDAIKRFLGRFLYRQQDIDDVAQETFLKAYSAEQDKEKGKDIQHPKAYLFQIARNAALEGLRKKSSQIADQIVDFDDGHFSFPVVIDDLDALTFSVYSVNPKGAQKPRKIQFFRDPETQKVAFASYDRFMYRRV